MPLHCHGQPLGPHLHSLARLRVVQPLQVGVDIEQHGIDTGNQQQDGSLDVAP